MICEQEDDVIRDIDYGRIKMTKSMIINEEEPQLLDVLDLSGMCLESLPNPSINLALICKLDLSNNNLQVFHYLYVFVSIFKTNYYVCII